MHPMIEKARQRRQQLEAKRQQVEARQRAFKGAMEELEEREYRCSLPGRQDGDDSFLQIREDREALQELMDSDDGEPDMLPREHRPQPSNEELLADIRDSLDGGSN